MTERIVITGAPGSGKTAFIDSLKSERAFQHFLFFDELARRLLTERPEYRNQWAEFHREIYRLQTGREESAGDGSFITDRGTVDAFAFHPETLGAVGTTLAQEYDRYSAVVQLGSTARLGETYYHTDDIRLESVSDALAIEGALMKAWGGHPRYRFVEAYTTWEEKYEACRMMLTDLMHHNAPSQRP